MNPWDTPLITKGMTAQLASRRARIAAGEKPLGWKVGMGAPASMQKLGLKAPLVGFLMQRALLASGGTVSLEGLHQAGGGAGDRRAHGARSRRRRVDRRGVGGDQGDRAGDRNRRSRSAAGAGQSRPRCSPATFSSARLVGATASAGRQRRRPDLAADPARRGSRAHERAGSADRQALDIVAHVASTLAAAFGETLSAGDIVITGSITPPLMHRTRRNRNHARDRSDRRGFGAVFRD